MRRKNQPNCYDRAYNDLLDAWRQAKEWLYSTVKRCAIKKEVIDLYPEGPDKEAAIKAFHSAQRALLCAIGSYDARLQELKNEYYTYHEKFTESFGSPEMILTSHEVIEYAYREYRRE